jgi:hypothetical protein
MSLQASQKLLEPPPGYELLEIRRAVPVIDADGLKITSLTLVFRELPQHRDALLGKRD